MSARLLVVILYLCMVIFYDPRLFAQNQPKLLRNYLNPNWADETAAKQLGWVKSDNECGGYFLDKAFVYPVAVSQNNMIAVTSDSGSISLEGVSILEDNVTFTRNGQQVTADKAYAYRHAKTHKLTDIKLVGNVQLREPNTLVIGDEGRYWFDSSRRNLTNILYRTAIIGRQMIGAKSVSAPARAQERIVSDMTAWGKASRFHQKQPLIYRMNNASYSTCPPIAPTWQVKASHIVLDKNVGRGYATHARVLVKDVPLIYLPYISFPIDRQRKSGFLWPTFGLHSDKWGPYVLAPYYWNMAPNYDMTVTTGLMQKRGLQLTDYFRYLSHTSRGFLTLSIAPYDFEFSRYQDQMEEKYAANTNPIYQAELRRLLDDSLTRKGFWWRDDSRFNDHWSTHVDFNYAGDDYYLRDFGNNLNEIILDQLLQQAEVFYKGENWNFTGRLHGYQTLHPIEDTWVANQYRRLPQLILDADYPNLPLGLEFFINNEAVHFNILNDPGIKTSKPVGRRFHTQPGISLPVYTPFLYVNPRLQVALTEYHLKQTTDTDTPTSIRRGLPIFDLLIGAALYQDIALFGYDFKNTVEPQAYYTYIPYRKQSEIPIFDTTVNNLTYDQIFNYNRFSGIDRIGDANQVGLGISSTLIDNETGLEKARLGIGQIIYFSNRKVTLCNDNTCSDNPDSAGNKQKLSPISGVLDYHLNPSWRFSGMGIINPITGQLDATNLALNYHPDADRSFNLGFGFARAAIGSGVTTTNSQDNLKVTDVSFAWPVYKGVSAVGRWNQNWNHGYLLNLLYGLQYDTCCWAVRLVGGRAFTGLDPTNNNLNYDSQFYIQFNLKGLGNIGSGNPKTLLSSITGYNPQFGQEF